MPMPSLRTFSSLLLSAISLAAAAQPPAPAPATRTAPPTPVTRIFAPYVDMTKKTQPLTQIKAESGARMFTLAFIQSVDGCVPGWGGTAPIADDTAIAADIAALRAAGGDVIVAVGGYDGKELGEVCPDVPSLQAAYQQIVDKYKIKILDLDIEHTAIEDPVSIDRRNQALTKLAAANPGLQLNYTLGAYPVGLAANAQYLIKSAVANNTPVTVVNLMTMDYGVPVPTGAMGVDAVATAAATMGQLKLLGMTGARIGITPMIGTNDTVTETFTLRDAQDVVTFAKANNWVALIAYWSVSRDNGTCQATVSALCSGITQGPYDFARIFAAFDSSH